MNAIFLWTVKVYVNVLFNIYFVIHDIKHWKFPLYYTLFEQHAFLLKCLVLFKLLKYKIFHQF